MVTKLQIIFEKVQTKAYIYIENVKQRQNFYDSDEIEIRLSFYRSSSRFRNTYWWSLHSGFLLISMGFKRWLEVICTVKSSHKYTTQPQSKYKSRNFQNLIRKRSLRHSLKPKTNWNFRVLLGLTMSTITQLNFLFVFFPIQQQLWHSNMM